MGFLYGEKNRAVGYWVTGEGMLICKFQRPTVFERIWRGLAGWYWTDYGHQ